MPYANAQISSNLTLPGLIVEALSTMNHLSHGWSPKKCNTNDPQVQPRCLQHASHVGCHLLCLHKRNAKHVAASCSLSSNVCELFPVLTEQLHCSQRRRNRRICPTSTNSQNICCRWESVVREDYQSIKPKKTAQKQSIIYWSGRPIHQSSKKSVGLPVRVASDPQPSCTSFASMPKNWLSKSSISDWARFATTPG